MVPFFELGTLSLIELTSVKSKHKFFELIPLRWHKITSVEDTSDIEIVLLCEVARRILNTRNIPVSGSEEDDKLADIP